VLVKLAEDLLDRLRQHDGLFGAWLPAHGLMPRFLPAGRGPSLAVDVAAFGAVMADPVGALPQRDACEKPPQTVPPLGPERAFAITEEKALESRLHHVLGFDLVLKLKFEP